jgi:hypothetical protein
MFARNPHPHLRKSLYVTANRGILYFPIFELYTIFEVNMARKFSCKYCHKKFTQSKSRKRHIRVQHTKVDYTQARKSFDRRVKTIEGFCKFESQQEIDLNEVREIAIYIYNHNQELEIMM